MTIFDYIGSILFTKKRLLPSTIDSENEFSPYLINRWLSMYSLPCAKNSNIINRYLTTLNKSELYSLFFAVFDKVNNKKISYFKRCKEEEDSENIDLVKKFAIFKEISSREIKEYLKTLNYKAG